MKKLIIIIILSGVGAENILEKGTDRLKFLKGEAFTNDGIIKHKEIPEYFARPYEKKSWSEYRKLFIKESRIVSGAKFYIENKELIQRVVDRYKVDPFIIVSIAGIESNYGNYHKGFTVFNSLYTQIHEMPKRANWATRELATYLEYCFQDQIDPHVIKGSYAGADGARRPHNWPDVLASISNYLRRNGYIPNSTNYDKGGDIWKSVWAYNHADNYVMAVLELGEKIQERVIQEE